MNLLINGIKGFMGRTIKELAQQDNFWENIHGLSRENHSLRIILNIMFYWTLPIHLHWIMYYNWPWREGFP